MKYLNGLGPVGIFLLIFGLWVLVFGLTGCVHSINGHPCEKDSRQMDCMLSEGRL